MEFYYSLLSQLSTFQSDVQRYIDLSSLPKTSDTALAFCFERFESIHQPNMEVEIGVLENDEITYYWMMSDHRVKYIQFHLTTSAPSWFSDGYLAFSHLISSYSYVKLLLPMTQINVRALVIRSFQLYNIPANELLMNFLTINLEGFCTRVLTRYREGNDKDACFQLIKEAINCIGHELRLADAFIIHHFALFDDTRAVYDMTKNCVIPNSGFQESEAETITKAISMAIDVNESQNQYSLLVREALSIYPISDFHPYRSLQADIRGSKELKGKGKSFRSSFMRIS